MPVKTVTSFDKLADLERFADKLPPRYLQIGRLYLQGMSQVKIAKELHISQTAVHANLVRTVEKLRCLAIAV